MTIALMKLVFVPIFLPRWYPFATSATTWEPTLFRTLSIPVLSGREFSSTDRSRGDAQAVTVVNESFAREVFGNINPVGHTLTAPRLPQWVLRPGLLSECVGDSEVLHAQRKTTARRVRALTFRSDETGKMREAGGSTVVFAGRRYCQG